MTLTRPRRHQLILTWIGIGVTWTASCVLEVMLLSERVGLVLALTTTIAVCAGAIATKKLTAREHRASIKVSDLRAARSRRL
jgi:hypothetical protein